MNNWEKCPICNGIGSVFNGTFSNGVCPTCKGQRIIHSITGLPPNIVTNTYTSGNTIINDNLKPKDE